MQKSYTNFFKDEKKHWNFLNNSAPYKNISNLLFQIFPENVQENLYFLAFILKIRKFWIITSIYWNIENTETHFSISRSVFWTVFCLIPTLREVSRVGEVPGVVYQRISSGTVETFFVSTWSNKGTQYFMAGRQRVATLPSYMGSKRVYTISSVNVRCRLNTLISECCFPKTCINICQSYRHCL